MGTPGQDDSMPNITDTTQEDPRDTAKNGSNENSCGPKCLYLAIIVLVVVVIGLAVGIGTKSNNNKQEGAKITMAPSSTPTSSFAPSTLPTVSPKPSVSPSLSPTGFEEFLNFTLPGYTLQSLQDNETPQSKALFWIFSYVDYKGLPPWRKRQLFTLATLYFSLKGEQWSNQNWLSEDNECLWNIDTTIPQTYTNTTTLAANLTPCNELGQIQSIQLVGLDLLPRSGPLPAELEFLSHLRSFGWIQSPAYAPLAEVLPTTLYQMSSLEELLLVESQFLRTIPTQLGLLTRLKGLYLRENNLILKIPSELGKLTALEWLDLSGNSLTGSLPTELGMLTTLKWLNISHNFLSKSIPAEIQALRGNYSLSILA